MPYVEDRGGLDFDGKDPWKGYPAAIVGRVMQYCDDLRPRRAIGEITPDTRFYPLRSGQRPDPTAPCLDSLDLDSLDDVELVIEIEKEFSISIPDADAQTLETVGQLILYVKDRIGPCRDAS